MEVENVQRDMIIQFKLNYIAKNLSFCNKLYILHGLFVVYLRFILYLIRG